MKAYQIVIKGNEKSEEYAEISRRSFQPAIDEGIISEIVTFDAITPESPDFQEHVDKYVWKSSLMTMDKNAGNKDDHSPTEKAGMCSHWELMRIAYESDERFFIMEHDTFLLRERMEAFSLLVDYTPQTLYSNIGLFMGMYSVESETAAWMYDLLVNADFPINCGPYCTLQRLFRTYTTNHLKRPDVDYRGIRNTAIHPWHQCDTLGIGRDIGLYFNNNDTREVGIPTPTTQVISKRLAVTQDHHGYSEKNQLRPWERHPFFKVIE